LPPYAVRVGDYLLPKPLSGHPALELCNTLAGWDDPPERRNEWLTTYDHFAVWAEYAGLVERRQDGSDDALLTEVRALRSAAYRLFRHGDAAEFEVIAVYANEANAHRRLTRGTDGAAGFRLPADGDLRLPLLGAALAVADLLDRPERTTVRACPGDGCGWLFLDPRGRRVWCNMAACGNRAKVRAHAARQRGDE
jgi:predicted RNA-binding Zn ribbon-like protein